MPPRWACATHPRTRTRSAASRPRPAPSTAPASGPILQPLAACGAIACERCQPVLHRFIGARVQLDSIYGADRRGQDQAGQLRIAIPHRCSHTHAPLPPPPPISPASVPAFEYRRACSRAATHQRPAASSAARLASAVETARPPPRPRSFRLWTRRASAGKRSARGCARGVAAAAGSKAQPRIYIYIYVYIYM